MLADGRATLVHDDPVVDSRDPVVRSSLLSDPPPTDPEPKPRNPSDGPAPVAMRAPSSSRRRR